MGLILVGVGLSILIIPIVYSLGVLALWAKIRSLLGRIVAVTVALAIAASIAYRMNILPLSSLVTDTESEYEIFATYCEDNVAGEVYSRLQNVESLGLTPRASSDPQLNPNILGHAVLPPSLASRLTLSGVNRYKLFNGSGFYEFVDERGLQSRSRTMPGASLQVGMEWELSERSTEDSIASLVLRVTDLQTGKTLGVQPAFIWLGVSGDSVPLPTFVPGRVRDPVIATCPQPLDVIQFVKDVARPGTGDYAND